MALIETMTFRLAPATDQASFLDADRQVQTSFAYHQPGLLRRTTARGDDGGWIVVDVWRSGPDADACAQRWTREPTTVAFMALVDGTSVRTQRYTTLD
jgi:hypothetical protein